MKIVHIGGTGFLGSRIVKKLIAKNYEVTIITRNPQKQMSFDKSKVSFIKADILDLDTINLSGKYDVLVYTAMPPFRPGRISRKSFLCIENITKNYIKNTFAFAKKLSCPLILTLGASYETDNNQVADESWPICRKGIALLGQFYDKFSEEIKNKNEIPLIEMLPSQIYGNGGKFSMFLKMAAKGRLVILGDGRNCIPRIHVDDCAEAFVLAIEKLPVGKRFIISDDCPVTVKEFMKYFAVEFNVKLLLQIPTFLIKLFIGKYLTETLTMNTIVSNEHAKTELGWTLKYPTYKEGLHALRINQF